ncbi:MAG: hypothetical protein PVSMB1_01110 [Gemmatimonadaceae bacterium]
MPAPMAAELRDVIATLRGTMGKARGAQALALLDRTAADAPVAVFLADNQGRYVWANASAAELLGYSRAEVLRLSVWDVTPVEAEADLDLLWRSFLRSSYQYGTYPVRRKSGRKRWVYYFAEPRLLPGVHVSVLKAIPSIGSK